MMHDKDRFINPCGLPNRRFNHNAKCSKYSSSPSSPLDILFDERENQDEPATPKKDGQDDALDNMATLMRASSLASSTKIR